MCNQSVGQAGKLDARDITAFERQNLVVLCCENHIPITGVEQLSGKHISFFHTDHNLLIDIALQQPFGTDQIEFIILLEQVNSGRIGEGFKMNGSRLDL